MNSLKRDKIKINNVLISLMLGSTIISDTIGFGLVILIVTMVLIIVNNFDRKVNKKYILCCLFMLFIGLYFIIDYLAYGGNIYKNSYFGKLILYLFLSIIYVKAEIQPDKVANITILIYVICSPLFLTKNFDSFDSGTLMSYSYTVLPLIILMIIKIFFLGIHYKKELILLLLSTPYLYFVFVYASRNIYIAALVCFIICLILNKKIFTKILVLAITAILVMVVYQNALNILTSMQKTLAKYDISFKIIDKNIELIQEDNISNGRDLTYSLAISGIKNAPILGHGIGSFNVKYGTYPHNFVLQMLYEGGIVLLLIFSIPILYGVYALIFENKLSQQNKFLLLFLFCTAIMRLLISYEYWREIYFWMYISLSLCILATNKKKKEKEENK